MAAGCPILQAPPFIGVPAQNVQAHPHSPCPFSLPHSLCASGGQAQWWKFKAANFDAVIFFKMGKFYELFEMDAHVGVEHLGLQYMAGAQPHAGFPGEEPARILVSDPQFCLSTLLQAMCSWCSLTCVILHVSNDMPGST